MYQHPKLFPGYILVHHDTQWWDMLMDFGEAHADGEATRADNKATHIDVVSGWPGIIAKQNPPKSTLYQAGMLDFNTITLLGFKPIMGEGGLVDVHKDAAFVGCLDTAIKAHLGEAYDWGQILHFANIGIEGLVDQDAAMRALHASDRSSIRGGHYGVCSVWTQKVLEEALRARFGRPFDLTLGSVAGADDAEPADWTTFPMLEVKS